jgi:hypothetical protein
MVDFEMGFKLSISVIILIFMISHIKKYIKNNKF